ncbi:hypothetical protein ASE41_17710 [Streptomyces sp. Root264]|nr:hypothetical protein ASE41_17710 [Streptomyces sp. Root264]
MTQKGRFDPALDTRGTCLDLGAEEGVPRELQLAVHRHDLKIMNDRGILTIAAEGVGRCDLRLIFALTLPHQTIELFQVCIRLEVGHALLFGR